MGELQIYFDQDNGGYRTCFEKCWPNEVLDFLNFYPKGKVLFVPVGYPLSVTLTGRTGGWEINLDNIPKLEVKSMFGAAIGIVVLDDKTGEFFNDTAIISA